MGVIAAEYRCCLAVSNDLRDGVQAVLGRVRRLPHPDQRVNAGGVQRVFTVDYARPAQAQHGVGIHGQAKQNARRRGWPGIFRG